MSRHARRHLPAATPNPAAAVPTVHRPSGSPRLFARRAFRLVFAASAGSMLGTAVSYLAIPLVAVHVLHAGAGQVGVLGVLGTLAFVVLGLPVGVWVDRVRRRGVMVCADLVRAVLLASVPLAWWIGVLTMWQLYTVVLLAGVATLFFEVAALSYLPWAAGRDALVSANAVLSSTGAAAGIVGRSLGGLLVQALTAPVAVLLDAVSYLWSAACLLLISGREPRPVAGGPDRRLARGMRDGVRYVCTHPVLRPVAVAGALTNLSLQMSTTVLPLLFTRELGLPDAALGAFLAVGGVGVLAGAAAAAPLGRRLGNGRALWVAGMVAAPLGCALPLARGPLGLWAAAAAWLVVTAKVGVDNVILVSFRQGSTPDHLLGRVNATIRFLLTGALSLGAALAGGIGQVAGVRAALWASAAVLALTWLPVLLSPLRGMRDLPGGAGS